MRGDVEDKVGGVEIMLDITGIIYTDGFWPR